MSNQSATKSQCTQDIKKIWKKIYLYNQIKFLCDQNISDTLHRTALVGWLCSSLLCFDCSRSSSSPSSLLPQRLSKRCIHCMQHKHEKLISKDETPGINVLKSLFCTYLNLYDVNQRYWKTTQILTFYMLKVLFSMQGATITTFRN